VLCRRLKYQTHYWDYWRILCTGFSTIPASWNTRVVVDIFIFIKSYRWLQPQRFATKSVDMNGLGGGPMTPLGVVVNGHSGPDLLDDFEPQPRDRCNTWPLQKPAGDLGHHTSPLMHEVYLSSKHRRVTLSEMCLQEIPEEGDDDDLSSTDSTICYQDQQNQSTPVTFYTGSVANGDQSALAFACHGSFQASNTSLSIPIADVDRFFGCLKKVLARGFFRPTTRKTRRDATPGATSPTPTWSPRLSIAPTRSAWPCRRFTSGSCTRCRFFATRVTATVRRVGR